MIKILKELLERYPALKGLSGDLESAVQTIISSYEKNGKLFVCGNGGSASDAEHIAGEMLKGFLSGRRLSGEWKDKFKNKLGNIGTELADKLQCGLKTISLNSHPAFVTAFGNDVDSSMVYAQQLFALAAEGDVLLGISTSGNAENIYKSILTAKVIGVKTILLTGANGGRCAEVADIAIKTPETETFKIQEYHLPVYHAMCAMIEEYFYGER